MRGYFAWWFDCCQWHSYLRRIEYLTWEFPGVSSGGKQFLETETAPETDITQEFAEMCGLPQAKEWRGLCLFSLCSGEKGSHLPCFCDKLTFRSVFSTQPPEFPLAACSQQMTSLYPSLRESESQNGNHLRLPPLNLGNLDPLLLCPFLKEGWRATSSPVPEGTHSRNSLLKALLFNLDLNHHRKSVWKSQKPRLCSRPIMSLCQHGAGRLSQSRSYSRGGDRKVQAGSHCPPPGSKLHDHKITLTPSLSCL